jgi:hypothetical protein
MRPEFDENGVFPRQMLAGLGRSGIVKLKAAGGGARRELPVDVVAIR